MQPDLSIIIVNWNVASLLAACLRSLPSAAGDWWVRAEVVVVDNASTDDSLAMLRRDFPEVRLLALPRNVGFARGNNAGIGAARGRLLLLLNPDTVAHPGSIASLCDYMDEHSEVGIAGPRLLNPDGTLQPSRRRFPTLGTALVESTPLQRYFRGSGVLRRFYMEDVPEDETQQVGWLSGAVLLCRREALDQAGPFDPRYFMFSEEVDLCKRVSEAGWAIVYVPASEVTHYGGGSTEQALAWRHINFNTSKARYFRIHEGRAAGTLVRLYLLGMFVAQSFTEAAKWLLGHKRALRAERLRMYAQVIASGLKGRTAGDRRPATGDGAGPALFITGEYPPARGGVGDYTCRLTTSLARSEGVGVRVLTRGIGESSDSGGALGEGRALVRPPFRVGRKITVRAALRALRRGGARVAHIQYQTGAYEMRPTINLMPLLLRALWPGRVVVTFHDLLVPYLFPKAGPVRGWANRLMALGASAVVATNPSDAETLRGWGARRVELIPIGSNIPKMPPEGYSREAWRRERGVSEGTVLLAYFGFLNSTKGLDDLLRAMAALGAREGRYRLMMVGGGLGSSDPTNRQTAASLDALAKSLGLDGALLWTGYLDAREVSAALLSADIAVLPYADGASFRRGSLMAVLEHALPVITTKPRPVTDGAADGWPSLVDGQNALLVPPGDPDALRAAIEQVAAGGALRVQLAEGARELAAYFGWDRIAALHAEMYRRLR